MDNSIIKRRLLHDEYIIIMDIYAQNNNGTIITKHIFKKAWGLTTLNFNTPFNIRQFTKLSTWNA